MKKRKILGVTLMASALLLQVGYATTTTMDTYKISNTKAFQVYFEEVTTQSSADDVKVEVLQPEGTTTLNIKAKKLYPGSDFKVSTKIKNYGSTTAKISDIYIKQIGDITPESTKLYEKLVGYNGEIQLKGDKLYNDYLLENYMGKEIKSNEEMLLTFGMGLDFEVEDLQNASTEFELVVTLEQVTSGNGGGSSEEPGEDDTIPDNEVEVPEEPVPGGPVDIPDGVVEVLEEPVPGGEVIIPDDEIGIPEENIPAGGMLPKTGGITPYLVYGLGMTMLCSGIMIYRKKE